MPLGGQGAAANVIVGEAPNEVCGIRVARLEEGNFGNLQTAGRRRILGSLDDQLAIAVVGRKNADGPQTFGGHMADQAIDLLIRLRAENENTVLGHGGGI